MTIDIRSFEGSDRAAITKGRNQGRPAHHQNTVAEWERNDAQRPADEVSLRLCVGEPAFAYLSAEDRSTTARRKPGVCGFQLWIDPAQWNEAAADALYGKAVEFARLRGLTRMTTYLTLYAYRTIQWFHFSHGTASPK